MDTPESEFNLELRASLGHGIANARRAHGLTMTGLARMARTSPDRLRRAEQGIPVRVSALRRIARSLPGYADGLSSVIDRIARCERRGRRRAP